MDKEILFSTFKLGGLNLKNRVVMSPMTRNRANSSFIPQEIVATYYAQRASAGLIITEGTAPSANGLGYPRTPGIYNEEQVSAWKKVSDAVHQSGGHIFMQLMHCGRIANSHNKPAGSRTIAPSAVQASGQIYTDVAGMQDYSIPSEMTESDIEATISEYVHASANAIKAGFDGVEIHGANGYLVEQFLNPKTNNRTDKWGGNTEKRSTFALEVAKRIAAEIGAKKVGIRLSPFGAFNDVLPAYDGIEDAYESLAGALSEIGLVYIHVLDHSSMGAPKVPESIKAKIRKAFKGTFIASGGFDLQSAEETLAEGKAELIGFGKLFISNPDLVNRMKNNEEFAAFDMNTFYTPGSAGYIDYPVFA